MPFCIQIHLLLCRIGQFSFGQGRGDLLEGPLVRRAACVWANDLLSVNKSTKNRRPFLAIQRTKGDKYAKQESKNEAQSANFALRICD